MSELTLRRRHHRAPPPHPWVALAGFLAASFLAAAVGGLFPARGPWYDALAKPSWNPPSWVFGPVWTTLYVLMAVAAWQVWRTRGFREARGELSLWFAQLLLNAAWPALFFGLHRPGLALVDIVLLILLVAATAVAFRRVRRVAGLLMLPYLAWVMFATALNFAIWRMN